jgi:predicted RNase H-like nuclease (RuvC/YqgF family)
MSENNLNDLDNSNAEVYRRELVAINKENNILRENVKQLQEQLQNSYKRIEELSR